MCYIPFTIFSFGFLLLLSFAPVPFALASFSSASCLLLNSFELMSCNFASCFYLWVLLIIFGIYRKRHLWMQTTSVDANDIVSYTTLSFVVEHAFWATLDCLSGRGTSCFCKDPIIFCISTTGTPGIRNKLPDMDSQVGPRQKS